MALTVTVKNVTVTRGSTKFTGANQVAVVANINTGLTEQGTLLANILRDESNPEPEVLDTATAIVQVKIETGGFAQMALNDHAVVTTDTDGNKTAVVVSDAVYTSPTDIGYTP